MNVDALTALSSRLGVTFSDPGLLLAALTHPSWSEGHPGEQNYQRLEFLGDSVLGFVVAAHLFENLPDRPEGDLTRMKWALAAGTTLAAVGRDFGLDEALRLGKGEARTGAKDSVVEACFEAVVGAVYLDQGLDEAASFVLRALGDRLDPATLAAVRDDPKSALQQLTQARGLGLPSYHVVSSSGPAHDPVFVAEVVIGKESVSSGQGGSKQAAEQQAALVALEALITPAGRRRT
jgi:ribonuclease-3